MLAFAGNSVLCRLALKDETIDPAGYTLVRLIAGAVFLALLSLILLKPSRPKLILNYGNWPAATALFIYAATLSFGYISIDTGAGALILFGFVQLSMILIGAFRGHRLALTEWAGTLLAFGGLSYMLLPGSEAPDLAGFVLMAISGAAWGVYTLIGRGSAAPLADTSGNFLRSCIPALILLFYSFGDVYLTERGLLLAIASGALASGAGYAVWYAVISHLRVSQAAVVQLSVPVIAAVGGLLFAAEPITSRFVTASLLVLGGIAIVTFTKKPARQ
jgi:drug/metabolite transporter (DMT)-like permease